MAFQKLQVVNFGKSKGNGAIPSGVGYTIFDSFGNIITPRTTSSIFEMIAGSGNYACYVTYSSSFHGSILWDTGTVFSSTYYAGEEFNHESNNPNVDLTWSALQGITGSIQLLRDMTMGRWKIENNMMIFYSESSDTTPVATFNLFDDLGAPSMDAVFERVKSS